MTAKEAIKTIQVAIGEVEWEYPLDYSIAFETAIEALKEHVSAEKILHSFAKAVKNLSITKLIAIVKNMTDL